MPLFSSVNWDKISEVLGSQAGANANYVFKSDGYGSGTMVPNLQVIAKRITVGLSGDVDYTSIAAALTAADLAGCSATNPCLIEVYPGTYTEPPMDLKPGMVLISTAHRMDTAFIVASNSTADLFTCTGGYISGFVVSGVTDPSYCLFRCATAATQTVFHGVRIFDCSTGWDASNGATVLHTTCSAVINGPSQSITTFANVSDAYTYFGALGNFVACPAAVLPLYASNPIQTVYKISSNAEAYISGASYRVASKDSTADIIYAEGGSKATIISADIANSCNALHIGSTGANTKISALDIIFTNNTLNVFIESSTGVVFSNFSTDILRQNIVAGGKNIGIIQSRDEDQIRLIGELKFRFPTNKDLDLTDYFYDFCSTGASEGGDITLPGGLFVDVAGGEGFIRRSEPYKDSAWYEWEAVSGIAVEPNATNYIYFDSNDGYVKAGVSAPGETGMLLGQVITDGYNVRYNHHTGYNLSDYIGRLNQYLLDTRAIVWKTGLACSQGTTNLNFGIDPGTYYFAMEEIVFDGYTPDAYWSYFYGSNGTTEVSDVSLVNITEYDFGGTLTTMTDGYFRQDTIYLTSDGRINVIYGTAEYETIDLAQSSSLNSKPTFLEPTGCSIAKLIIEKNVGISSIIDARPVANAAAAGGGGAGTSSHSALSDLDNPADHPWAFLVDGTRPMTGDIDVGGNSVTNVNLVDGVDVSAHATRHSPGGLDALATATPTAVLVAAAAAEGSASSFARSDHQHGVAADTPVTIGTANADGTSSSVARADHVHDHGQQTDGYHHAVVTDGYNGFMSSTMKIKLDGIAEGATAITLSDTAPNNVDRTAALAGVSSEASRQDHKHDISTAIASTLSVGGTNSAGSSSSLSRADHLHAITRGVPVSVGTANNAGVATSFAASDHVHSGLTRGAADFSTFAVKGSPTNSDVLLIEDAAAAEAKKYITIGTLPFTNTALASTAPANVDKSAAAVGVGTTAARADHKHDISTAAPTSVGVGTASSEGVATTLARSDHIHQSNTTPSDVSKSTAAIGSSVEPARADHKHDITTAAPAATGVGTTSSEGTATTLARSDHTHQSNTVPLNITKASAAIGTSGEPARADHKHDISTATPSASAVVVGNAAAEGTATSLARSDHIHAVSVGVPVSVGTANSVGVATTFSASDHVHSGLTRGANDFTVFTNKATPVSADVLLIEDSAAAGVKKNITISGLALAVGGTITNSEVSGTATTTTTSATDVLVSGMSITPAAGTYLVWFSGEISFSNTSQTVTPSIYYGGTLLTHSERPVASGANSAAAAVWIAFSCQGLVTVNGAQAIEGRWRTSVGTATNTRRTMNIIKVG